MKIYTMVTGVVLITVLALCMASCGKGSQTAAKLDLNTATAQQLQNVPGIDSTLAQNIVAFRDANGPFSSVDDLLKVSGMDQQKFNSLRNYVTVEGTSGSQPMDKSGSGGQSRTGT